MIVHELPNDSTFSKFVAETAMRLVVIDFYADWFGPCRMISSYIDRLSEKYPEIVFTKINVETCKQTSTRFRINAMPTFVFLYNGLEVDRMIGANVEMLETKIVQQIKQSLTATSDERIFLKKFVKYSQRMQIYEDEISQTLARSLMPYDKLMEASKVNGIINKFELVKLLLNWFKTDFFAWTDIPKCELCGQNSEKSEEAQVRPTEEERKWGAYQVEVFKCQKCNVNVRFPRYNDPVKLLETRCGRCGEWANCFTLCSRAVGLETRWVYDVTDHVWCEIWIEDLDRWVHCDPCENIIDTPLLYEKGWRKNLSYVIAFGLDHIRDVTWRYTFNHFATLGKRNSCREIVLRNFMRRLNIQYASLISEERKKEMERRYMKELVEFISPTMQIRDGNKVEEQGRITGTEEWLKQREETGSRERVGRVLVPNEKEIFDKVFSLEYDCAKDQYRRGGNIMKGWASLISKQKNVCRIMDQANSVAYICCQKGKANGELCWSFDLVHYHVKNIEFRLDGIKKNDDVMKAVICCGDICTVIPSTGKLELETTKHSKIDLKIYFSDGNAQLFPTNLYCGDYASFHVKIFF